MTQVSSKRIESIDILRGLVMIIMVLDHVRDYFHINAFAGNYPENLESTHLVLYFTRFITHYCAPVFVFLAGTSAYLYGQKNGTKALSKFLITRGIWLIIVEIIINNFLWWFDISYGMINLQVIWAIGFCMIILGLLIHLPKKILLTLGFLIVLGHNMLDSIHIPGESLLSIIWKILHELSCVSIGEARLLCFSYPVLPWIGVIILGYSFGYFYKKGTSIDTRKKWLLILGISSITLFFILRTFNLYGDSMLWSEQESFSKTIISYFILSKYPPSLLFLLVTLGPSLLFLYIIENIKNSVTNFLIVFGRVPFFFYVIHVFVVHVGAVVGLLITGKDWRIMILNNETMSSGALSGYGYSLGIVYLVWITIIIVLYPICKWFMKYKATHKGIWWLSYI
ncbi:heparan-alpha-glucosaminide N-acetyltransferase domain-containing protein [uncultured Dokdonia sp.]|uniref:DUF1624 domain-containing protein n=1 Tax=uncultured Dokdonia sp. TaxID=575653 RepID=UPI00262CB26B|nr:heparan-alpha-glucosaminide N-acetyltransferase domain-containing protein [uncultured Dokdonia sp.]